MNSLVVGIVIGIAMPVALLLLPDLIWLIVTSRRDRDVTPTADELRALRKRNHYTDRLLP